MSLPGQSSDDAPDEAFMRTFLEMLKESSGKAVSFAFSILENWYTAKDVTQDTSTKCLKDWRKCRSSTKEGMRAWFFVCLRTACQQEVRDQIGRGSTPRVIVPFDEQVAVPGWEEQHATSSPADLLGDREDEAEKLRVLQRLVSLLPANYQHALWERSLEKPSQGYAHSNVEFFRAKEALVELARLYQKASHALEECPHRFDLNQLSTASLRVLQTWLVKTGSTVPKADGPWRLYASEPKWIAFRASIQSFRPAHRVLILIDLIPVFRELNS